MTGSSRVLSYLDRGGAATKASWIALAAVLGVLTGAPGPADAAELDIAVTNVGSAAGRIRVLVCTAEQFLQPSCPVRARVPARQGAMLIRIPGVTPGRWAVTVHHDANGNDDVDQNFIGIPTEGIGFSRNPGFRLGAPRFDDVAVEVADAPLRIEVRLRFEPGG